MVAYSPLPLTLLSGFLGSGKTTLLQNVLKNRDGVKVAVIVNDLASVNVDANIVSKDVKGDDALVHLENGCICCDLNEEFVKQVVTLSKAGGFDYILVENTGVAEPEPVAESLVDPATAIGEAKDKLKDMVKLDTCVTVVDASMFFKHLHNSKKLNDTKLGEKVDTAEGEALICQLMANQIEYADVIALNKTDLLLPGKLKEVKEAVKALNPKAKVIPCEHGEIEWRKLLGTGSFSKINTAARPLAPGQPIRDSNFEDAVTSFVYSSRMPFHPERLYKFITEQAQFNLHQRDWSEEIAENANNALKTISQAAAAISVAATMLPASKASVRRSAEIAAQASLAAVAEAVAAGFIESIWQKNPMEIARGKSGKKQQPGGLEKGPFGRILRSKGQVWLAGASRYDHMGEWSLAGDVLQLNTGGPWISRLPLKLWPTDAKKRSEILQDLQPGVGDRKQELVFIGMDLKEEEIREALDACLCTQLEVLEMSQQDAMHGDVKAKDPFAPWPAIEALLPDSDGEEEEEDGEGDGDSEVEESEEEESEEEESEEGESEEEVGEPVETEIALGSLLDEQEVEVEGMLAMAGNDKEVSGRKAGKKSVKAAVTKKSQKSKPPMSKKHGLESEEAAPPAKHRKRNAAPPAAVAAAKASAAAAADKKFGQKRSRNGTKK